MKRIVQTALFYLLLLLLHGCKKESLPLGLNGERLFYLEGMVENQELVLEAGENGYFMETVNSIVDDSTNEMKGILLHLDSSNYKKYVEIVFYNPNTGIIPFSSNTSFLPGDYSFWNKQNEVLAYNVSFSSAIYNPDPDINYLWNFSDGSTSSDPNPVHTFSAADTFYSSCLTVSSPSLGSVSSICNDLFLSSKVCKADFNYSRLANTFEFVGEAAGLEPFRYSWRFNQREIFPITKNVSYTYDNVNDGLVDSVCFTSIDASGCAARHCKNIPVDPNVVNIANYDYTVKEVLQPRKINADDRLSVMVRYYDGKGRYYRSELSQQGPGDFFTVISSDSYKVDRRGSPTRRMEIAFNCLLSDGSTEIRLNIEKGVIAVAHP